MLVTTFFVLRRCVEALLAFLLVDQFDSVGSLYGAWHSFCDLPDLSKIGAVTVLVIFGSLIFQTMRQLIRLIVTRSTARRLLALLRQPFSWN